MTLLIYNGPPDQFDSEVGQALALAREDATVELPSQLADAADGETVIVSDVAAPASGTLEPGRVYDLPARLAEARLETSAHWSRVSKISDLTAEQLRVLAIERKVENRSKLTGKDLSKAVSAAAPATLPDPTPDAAAPAGGDTAPASSPAATSTTGVTT